MILDEKNELLEKQKKDYDEKLENLDKYLEKEPEHDSTYVNPTSLNLFS